MTFRLFPAAISVAMLTAGAAGSAVADELPPEVVGPVWEWVSFVTPKEELNVADPEHYTIAFTADGAVALQVACNRGMSHVTVKPDNRISFSPIGVTMMFCAEENLGHRFTEELERVGSFFMLEDDLLLELPYDSGTLRFRKAATTE
jgi:heat shock protein HslJ